jgi:hypothetical protein
MVRRMSANYVRSFIEESPVKHLLVDSTCNASVLQKSFLTNSTLFFSYAFLDVTRTRGINADQLFIDEIHRYRRSFIPILRETMSASQYKLEVHTGTPKTFDGPLEKSWKASSMAEWVIKCQACGHENIPSLEHDLDAMIGPDLVEREISEAYPGVVCAKCSRPVYPRTGRWIHRRPELRHDYVGYHVPQCILPMHYADPDAWTLLLAKRRGMGNMPQNVYYNECCGESFDTGAKLITQTDLMRASCLHPNRYDVAVKKIRDGYKRRILAVDWGSGGKEEISFTTAALLGLRANGVIDVIFGWRSLTPHDHLGEAAKLLKMFVDFKCDQIVHDYGGAGDVRESVFVAVGMPLVKLIPVAYIRSGRGALVRPVEQNDRTGERGHLQMDKARSLVLTCKLIQKGKIRFFEYDHGGLGDEGLIHDFLALVEDKSSTRLGSDIYTVIHDEAAGPDDFAQAVNIGVCTLFYQEQRWPDLSELVKFELTEKQIAAVKNLTGVSW